MASVYSTFPRRSRPLAPSPRPRAGRRLPGQRGRRGEELLRPHDRRL